VYESHCIPRLVHSILEAADDLLDLPDAENMPRAEAVLFARCIDTDSKDA
jgi:hypothetical protein